MSIPITIRPDIIAHVAAAAVGLVLYAALSSLAFAGDTIASGQFEGRSKHVTKGNVTIEKQGAAILVKLGPNFSLDGTPDPTLGFAKGGRFDTTTIFANLKSNSGSQTYKLPATIDPSRYDEFVVWCKKYSVPLGAAKLLTNGAAQ